MRQSASHVGPCTYAMTSVQKKATSSANLRRLRQKEEQSAHDQVVQDAAEARCTRSVGIKVERAGRAEVFSRKAVDNVRHGALRAQNVGTFHHPKKRGPDRSW